MAEDNVCHVPVVFQVISAEYLNKTRQLLLIIIRNFLDMMLPLEFQQMALSSLSVYLWSNHDPEFMVR